MSMWLALVVAFIGGLMVAEGLHKFFKEVYRYWRLTHGNRRNKV